jgi:cytochrome c-type biogenesis protein
LGSENLSLLVAFGAGILSFLSPCVLPMVPAYLGYLAGSSARVSLAEARRLTTLTHSASFVLGFSAVFVGFWASIGLIGHALTGYSGLFRQIGGVLLIVMGLHQAGLLRLSLLYRQFGIELHFAERPTPVTSLLVGVAFAAGWTPCIGPILAGIIGLASMSETVGEGALLLVAYSLGLGVPFLAAGLAVGQASTLMNRIKRHLDLVSVASGILLVVIGVLMLSDTFKLLPRYFNWGFV